MLPRTLGTHNGTFHADEVTACSLLLLFDCVDREKIVRTRDSHILDSCEYVCDVGGLYDPDLKRFDHHQISYKGALSSAGMVLLYLRTQGIIPNKIYESLNKALVWGVDAHDNGRLNIEPGICTFSQVIMNFVPAPYDTPAEIVTKAFFEAIDFTIGHIKRFIDRYHYTEQCRAVVAELMKKKEKILLFDKAMPWMDLFFDMGGIPIRPFLLSCPQDLIGNYEAFHPAQKSV